MIFFVFQESKNFYKFEWFAIWAKLHTDSHFHAIITNAQTQEFFYIFLDRDWFVFKIIIFQQGQQDVSSNVRAVAQSGLPVLCRSTLENTIPEEFFRERVVFLEKNWAAFIDLELPQGSIDCRLQIPACAE